jgi:hypothetical protein
VDRFDDRNRLIDPGRTNHNPRGHIVNETITWIAADDRLPDTDRDVLACMPGPDAETFQTWPAYLEVDGWTLADGATIAPTRITHWAELPKGPAAAEVTP